MRRPAHAITRDWLMSATARWPRNSTETTPSWTDPADPARTRKGHGRSKGLVEIGDHASELGAPGRTRTCDTRFRTRRRVNLQRAHLPAVMLEPSRVDPPLVRAQSGSCRVSARDSLLPTAQHSLAPGRRRW
jgi:hypothetical protein